MASSFIKFNGNGFWAYDCYVESFQLLLFERINDHTDIPWLVEYQRKIALDSLPLIYGGMTMYLDETITDEGRRLVLIEFIDKITNNIISHGGYLTGERLNSLRRNVLQYLVHIREFSWTDAEMEKIAKDSRWLDSDLSTDNYLKGFILLSDLVQGKLTFKVDSEITYWND